MAKKSINNKKVITEKLDITGTLNLDELQGFVVELEDEGEKDIVELLKSYNGKLGTLSFTVKTEELIEE